jgi:hypothetical protein
VSVCPQCRNRITLKSIWQAEWHGNTVCSGCNMRLYLIRSGWQGVATLWIPLMLANAVSQIFSEVAHGQHVAIRIAIRILSLAATFEVAYLLLAYVWNRWQVRPVMSDSEISSLNLH